MTAKVGADTPIEDAKEDGDAVAVCLFAQDLSEYAGEWIAADERGVIVAHDLSLREVRKVVSAKGPPSDVRYYAVPGEIQAT
jgi:hypothetical protein